MNAAFVEPQGFENTNTFALKLGLPDPQDFSG